MIINTFGQALLGIPLHAVSAASAGLTSLQLGGFSPGRTSLQAGASSAERVGLRLSAVCPGRVALMRQASAFTSGTVELAQYTRMGVGSPGRVRLMLGTASPCAVSLMRQASADTASAVELAQFTRLGVVSHGHVSLMPGAASPAAVSLMRQASSSSAGRMDFMRQASAFTSGTVELAQYTRLGAGSPGHVSLMPGAASPCAVSLMRQASADTASAVELAKFTQLGVVSHGRVSLMPSAASPCAVSLMRQARAGSAGRVAFMRQAAANSAGRVELNANTQLFAVSPCRVILEPEAVAPSVITGLRVSIAGRTVEIQGAVIRADLDTPYWAGSLEVASEEDFNLFTQGTDFTLHAPGSEDFALLVKSRSRQKDAGQWRWQINFFSPSALLGKSYAPPAVIDSSASMARAKFEQVMGQVVDWRMVDWMLLPGRLATEGASPLEAATLITEAPGCRIGAYPDGALYTEPYYPGKPDDWTATAPDITLTDWADVISASENYEPPTRFDSVQITDIEQPARTWTFTAEKDNSPGHTGTLKLHSYPWTTAVQVAHTGSGTVGLREDGVKVEEVEEEIEFKGGKASTSRPVYQLQSFTWRYQNLGEITAEQDTNELTAPEGMGYSIAQVRYTTRYLKYIVGNAADETTQFIAIEG